MRKKLFLGIPLIAATMFSLSAPASADTGNESVAPHDPKAVNFELTKINDSLSELDLEDGVFTELDNGDIEISNTHGEVREVLPLGSFSYRIIDDNSLVASSRRASFQALDGISQEKFCPIGKNPNGRCRGSNVGNTIRCVGVSAGESAAGGLAGFGVAGPAGAAIGAAGGAAHGIGNTCIGES